MLRGKLLIVAALGLTAFTAGCDDPEAKASLEVCLENRAADPGLAEILCQQSVEHAPNSRSGREAARLLDQLQAENVKAEAKTPQQLKVLVAQNFVKTHLASR